MHSTVAVMDQAARLREIVRQTARTTKTRHVRMMTVASGKGGVGKSTLSLNLALALAEAGTRVLLVDADHNLGNLSAMLGITPTYTLADILRDDCETTEAFMRITDRLNFVAGSSGDTTCPSLTERSAQEVVHRLRSLDVPTDVVILDLSAGIAPSLVSLCLAADETLVVTTDEPTAVMDAYALIKVITLTTPTHPLGVVVNNVSNQHAADETYKKLSLAVKTFLHRSLSYYGGIPADREVQRAVYAQKPLLRASPYSAAALSIRACSRRVIQKQPLNQEEYTR